MVSLVGSMVEQLGVGQAEENSGQTTLAFDPEFLECIARCGIAKYQAVKQMDDGQKIVAFVQVCQMEHRTFARGSEASKNGLEGSPSPLVGFNRKILPQCESTVWARKAPTFS